MNIATVSPSLAKAGVAPAIDLDSVHLELPTGEEVAAPKAAVESVDLVY